MIVRPKECSTGWVTTTQNVALSYALKVQQFRPELLKFLDPSRRYGETAGLLQSLSIQPDLWSKLHGKIPSMVVLLR